MAKDPLQMIAAVMEPGEVPKIAKVVEVPVENAEMVEVPNLEQ